MYRNSHYLGDAPVYEEYSVIFCTFNCKYICLNLNDFMNLQKNLFNISKSSPQCTITLNYCTYTNHVGVSPRALYCVVDTSYWLGRSLGYCRPALPKGQKYQMVKTQIESHIGRPIVWVSLSYEVSWGTTGIYRRGIWGFSQAL